MPTQRVLIQKELINNILLPDRNRFQRRTWWSPLKAARTNRWCPPSRLGVGEVWIEDLLPRVVSGGSGVHVKRTAEFTALRDFWTPTRPDRPGPFHPPGSRGRALAQLAPPGEDQARTLPSRASSSSERVTAALMSPTWV